MFTIESIEIEDISNNNNVLNILLKNQIENSLKDLNYLIHIQVEQVQNKLEVLKNDIITRFKDYMSKIKNEGSHIQKLIKNVYQIEYKSILDPQAVQGSGSFQANNYGIYL